MLKNKAYMAGQTPFFGDFPATWPNFGAEALAVAEDFCSRAKIFVNELLINDPPAHLVGQAREGWPHHL